MPVRKLSLRGNCLRAGRKQGRQASCKAITTPSRRLPPSSGMCLCLSVLFSRQGHKGSIPWNRLSITSVPGAWDAVVRVPGRAGSLKCAGLGLP